MSLKLLTLVWEKAPFKDGALLVLLALADFSNDQGISWPAVETIAHKARMSERHARRILREFEEQGVVKTNDGGPRHETNSYTICVEKLNDFPDRTKCPPPPEGGHRGPKAETPASETRTPVSPQPSGTVIEPPSEELDLGLKSEGKRFADWFLAELGTTGGKVRITPTTLASWADAYEKLIRIDKRTKDEVIAVCRWARKDAFWAQNFLTPVKLRNRNGDGITYFDVFENRRKHDPNKKSNGRGFEGSNIDQYRAYENPVAAEG